MATITTTESESTTLRVVEEPLYEVVNGRKVELPPMAIKSVVVASRLARHLGNHADDENLGHVVSEGLFILDDEADIRRRPDVAFVSYEHWPRERGFPAEGDWLMIPDLAVEVVSPNDRAEDALAKIREYFEAGVSAVWVVYPNLNIVHIFETFTSIRVVSGDSTLDGGTAVPGFRIALAKLFE